MASASEHREIEWQFDALDLRSVSRWLNGSTAVDDGHLRVAVGRRATHVDTYYDTNDRRFHRAGYVLRERQAARRREATLKSLESTTPPADGLRARRELTEALGRDMPLLH